jgi:kynurenine 3-monooxygenase
LRLLVHFVGIHFILVQHFLSFKFLLQKELSFELERRFPDRFIPRYSMVMFHHDIPYATAYERGRVQAQLLNELTQNATALNEIDLQQAAVRVRTLLQPLANS